MIKLRPDQFSRFHDLSEIEVKALLESCEYKRYRREQEIDMSNGGILMEGKIKKLLKDDEADSSASDSESEYGEGVEKGLREGPAFIYPTNKKYISKDNCRVFLLPPSLKEGLLSTNPEIFNHAFHDLEKVTHLHRHHKLHDQHKILKKQKTTLLGIPSQMAHDNPLEAFKNKGAAIANKYGKGTKGSKGSRSRRGSIRPRGMSVDSVGLPDIKPNKVAPLNVGHSDFGGSNTNERDNGTNEPVKRTLSSVKESNNSDDGDEKKFGDAFERKSNDDTVLNLV